MALDTRKGGLLGLLLDLRNLLVLLLNLQVLMLDLGIELCPLGLRGQPRLDDLREQLELNLHLQVILLDLQLQLYPVVLLALLVDPYGLWADWQESSGAAASGSWQASSSWQENSGAASSSWQESSGAAGDGGEDPNTPSNQLYYKARQWGGSDKDGRGRLRSEAPWYKPNWVPGITHGEGGYAALDGVWIPAGRAIHCADPGL